MGRRRTRWWSRPTRATARSWPSAPTWPSSPTSSPTTSRTGAARQRCAPAFRDFVAALPGPAVLCADDAGAARADRGLGRARDLRARPVGRLPGGHAGPVGDRGGASTLRHGDERVHVELPSAPGVHNATQRGGGAGRRPSPRGPLGRRRRRPGAGSRASPGGSSAAARPAGVTVVDSYDHLPTEVAAALAGAAWGPWRRVVAVFQPHRYSRTEALWRDFADAFVDGRPAGRHRRVRRGRGAPAGGDAASSWSTPCSTPTRGPASPGCPRLDDVLLWLSATLRPGDLCLTLGAGDLTSLAPRDRRPPRGRGR